MSGTPGHKEGDGYLFPQSKRTMSPALKGTDRDGTLSPRAGAAKAVSIAQPEVSPMILGNSKDIDDNEPFNLDRSGSSPKQHRVKVGRRLSGRPSMSPLLSSLPEGVRGEIVQNDNSGASTAPQGRHHRYHDMMQGGLVSQIQSWLEHEKAKRAERRAKRKGTKDEVSAEEQTSDEGKNERRPSDASEGSIALEKLEGILKSSLNISVEDLSSSRPPSRKASVLASALAGVPRRMSSTRKLRRQSTAPSSGDEYQDDFLVPSCEAVLDNSRTLGYTGGSSSEPDLLQDMSASRKSFSKDKDAWKTFKYEIVRLTHTLKLKGWRRVPMERSNEIAVERLSGALTNAVYVVAPPPNLDKTPSPEDSNTFPTYKKPPPKLLLRIYGPQVEHLIDREAELQILRRLARKRIGPRLLGTFSNGRFEEFFHARTLTAKDLRVPDTSKQIAKRMRELHEGIELLENERNDGPAVWRNWDKWLARCEEVITWVDKQILEHKAGPIKDKRDAWKERGLICGVEWSMFLETVKKYRHWLYEQSGGTEGIRDQLVFAHNDTQYGNILRLMPAGESPLLQPANEHKQLVVIDFEYSSANPPAIEFANHFSEWCYNYHDPRVPYACNTAAYPTVEEQRRFIRSYVKHVPRFPTATPGSSATTPGMQASYGPSSSISSFMLESRTPSAQVKEDEDKEAAEVESRVDDLLKETRMWRMANSAMWVAWGIVQAKVPGLDFDRTPQGTPALDASEGSDPLEEEEKGMKDDLEAKRPEEEADNEEFDYLGYAQERAMFFWGDALGLEIIKEEELPREVLAKVKFVGH